MSDDGIGAFTRALRGQPAAIDRLLDAIASTGDRDALFFLAQGALARFHLLPADDKDQPCMRCGHRRNTHASHGPAPCGAAPILERRRDAHNRLARVVSTSLVCGCGAYQAPTPAAVLRAVDARPGSAGGGVRAGPW